MSVRLRLLDEVSYDGRGVTGERSHALLAALAGAGGGPVADPRLVEAVWGDDRPAQPGKALQVVVSRTRGQTARDVVALAERGYRLGLSPAEVDASHQGELVRSAQQAERLGELVVARDTARAALALAVAGPGREPPPVEDLRAAGRAGRRTALAVLGRCASALGDHAEALQALTDGDPVELDEPTLAALLRSEAAVHGAPAALVHYERHREDVRERLGVDPGPVLQEVHADLLAADRPVREGVLHDATSLVGRDDDLRDLRALVRSSRVVSVLGPGGLGKTRLAHLLGRTAEQPVVHLVELVGVADGDDVVGELGSALGVRDSVGGLRTLTPEQRRDVRGRIAQQLDRAPTLLLLDNCEHVVQAVADLVAFLVAAAPRLRVVTTTRAPLGIAAERVFALGQLDDDAALDLFAQRARAARPGVVLDDDAVRRVARRLDGLPLAIELAAAKVRAMSVTEIDRRLDDRFALLRGADAGAPDRHRTLQAVIAWSWDLLDAPQRVALARLALFQDGFTLDAAEAVLGAGPGALAAVEALVGQSLLAVREAGPDLRYRMLETVREFGLLRLGDDEVPARAALRAWAVALAGEIIDGLHGRDQVAMVRRTTTEDTNLADVLREALAEPDPATVAVLVAALGGAWTIRGEHVRVVTMVGAIEDAFAGWVPAPDQVETAARAAGVVVVNSLLTELREPPVCRALLDTHGGDAHDPTTRATHVLLAALDDADPTAALTRVADGDDRPAAVLALQWLGHRQENAGDTAGSVRSGLRALELWRPEDGVWSRAFMQTHLAGLHAQAGDAVQAEERAAAALGVLDDLGAHDDATQLRAVLAGAAIQAGRFDEAERILDEMATPAGASVDVAGCVRAELALARGDAVGGLAILDRTVEQVRQLRFPGLLSEPGREPWTLFVESTALTAHVRHGPAGSGAALHAVLAGKVAAVLGDDPDDLDYPIAGSVLFALGSWELRAGDVDLAVRTLALAERFVFSRYLATMSWSWVHREAEQAAPGALDAAVTAFGDRRGAAVLDDARALVRGLTTG